MLTTDPQISAGFLRQRRNIILISIILLISEVMGLNLEKINILGNIFTAEDPQNLYSLLWIGWMYLLLRYYQYLKEMGDVGFRSKFESDFKKFLPIIVEKLSRDSSLLGPIKEEDIKGETPVFNTPRWESAFKVKLKFAVIKAEDHGNINPPKEILNVDLGFKYLISPYSKILFSIFLNTRYFSEYILPFIIAFLPVVYILR